MLTQTLPEVKITKITAPPKLSPLKENKNYLQREANVLFSNLLASNAPARTERLEYDIHLIKTEIFKLIEQLDRLLVQQIIRLA